ncbi:Caleosin, partial [Dichotomocladium elegans]
RRHVRFWDRTNKGYITPMDTAAGLSHLGYNVIVSLTFGALLTAILSYATQDSWLPDPRCRIHVQKWMRSKRRHRHHYPLFDEYGRFDTNRFDALFDKYAQSDLSRNVIKFSEVLQMANDYHQCGTSPTAWVCIAVQWAGIYLLIGKDGILRKKDVRAVFDVSLLTCTCLTLLIHIEMY